MTADPNGWPDASKPGVPKNPERSCLTPAEVAALVAAARREGAEAMRDACARTAVSAPTNEPMGGPRTDLRSGIYAAIRALPLPDADDHLGIPAAAVERAAKEGSDE